MGNFFKNLFLFMLIGYFVLDILNGILLPSNSMYFIATLLILAVGMLMVSPVLSFLTIRENFITNFLMTFLISFGLLYLLKIFMIDFYIEEYMFEGLQLGSIVVNSFNMVPLVSIAVGSLMISFLSATFAVLDKN